MFEILTRQSCVKENLVGQLGAILDQTVPYRRKFIPELAEFDSTKTVMTMTPVMHLSVCALAIDVHAIFAAESATLGKLTDSDVSCLQSAYISRIMQFRTASPCCLIVSMVLLKRLNKYVPSACLTLYNIQRLLLTLVMLVRVGTRAKDE